LPFQTFFDATKLYGLRVRKGHIVKIDLYVPPPPPPPPTHPPARQLTACSTPSPWC
jgi:hypothetical protein